MVDPLILLLFLISGAATGWLGVDLLPENLLIQVTNVEGLRWVLGGFGAFFGLLAGFFFQLLRRRLMRQVRTMPTDLLVSRAVGLILGLLVANLLLAPILLLPLPWEVVFVKPLAAILSNVFFGVLGYNLAEVHGRTLLRLFNPSSAEALLVAEGGTAAGLRQDPRHQRDHRRPHQGPAGVGVAGGPGDCGTGGD